MAKTEKKSILENRKQAARLNYLRIAPRKVRLVGNLIKGLSVNEAEAHLLFQRQRAARPLLKLLRSAVADAKNNMRLDADNLYVGELRVDQGPMLKRILPRARGMATPIQKKTSHITLVLEESKIISKPRFRIVAEKKTKLPPAEKAGRGSPKDKEKLAKIGEKEDAGQTKKPGFFRRIFRRKSV